MRCALYRSETTVGESRDVDAGAGEHSRAMTPLSLLGQFVQCKLVCALFREIQLQARQAWEIGQRISTKVRRLSLCSSSSILRPVLLKLLWDCTSQHYSSQTLYACISLISSKKLTGDGACMCD